MLLDKIYSDLAGKAERVFLSKQQVIDAEKKRRQIEKKTGKLGKMQKQEKDEVGIVNFVYTTLSTEGVPVTKSDAQLAYKFSQKNAKELRDENLKVSLDMIKGLRMARESKKGLSLGLIEDLHETVMAQYGHKHPGDFRKEQAHIYLRHYEKVEEIGFRPVSPDKIETELEKLVQWYNLNVGKLNAIELASLLHLRFYIIHPFEDGNKRVCRLLFNKALYDSGYPLLNISKNTEKYFDALVKSVEKKDEKEFVLFVLGEFLESK